MGRIKGFCVDCGEPLRKIDEDICFICLCDRIKEREKQEKIRNHREN